MTPELAPIIVAGFVGLVLGIVATTTVFLCLMSEVFPEDDPR